MFDIFYLTQRPGIFDHECQAHDIQEAQAKSRTRFFWFVTYLADLSDWDWNWEPPPWQAHQRHAWPSQWQRDSGVYLVPKNGYTDTHYHTMPQITILPDDTPWNIPDHVTGWDTSWHPDGSEPAFHYHFATAWQPRGGPEYRTIGATQIKYMQEPRANTVTRPASFDKLADCDFPWHWHPHPQDPPYIYVFGNQWWPAEKMPTVRYHTLGATEQKFMHYPRAELTVQHPERWHELMPCAWDMTWCPDPGDPPYIYVFGNQWWPAEKMPTLEYRTPGATEIKYVNQPRATLLPDDAYWEIPSGIDVADLDLSWRPDPGEPAYIYQFATQHQKTGGPVYRVPGATEIKYLDTLRVPTIGTATAIIEIDHMDGNAGQLEGVERRTRYVDSYLRTLQRIAELVADHHEYVWIVSSVCDYEQFDWSWHPEQWQATMLHVFASDDLKFGDTFFMHVPSFRDRVTRVKLLEWYDINFVARSVPRRPVPVVHHDQDSHVDEIREYQPRGPVVLFATEPITDCVPPVNLWRSEVKAVIPMDAGACRVLVPREAMSEIQTQVYDYDIIDRTHMNHNMCKPMDIVFISNGETNADENWARLLLSKQGSPNRCVRVDGVNGRAAAYHAAAEASETAWFFAVFAKLEVLDNFDWSWQPDRLQQPKHYIFHALNPVNQLEYGHQAMIAYNKKITLANPGRGLDFTLDDAHEVVPELSGIARYNTDPWTAWRTAFREVIKLRASLPDVENEYRMKQWLTVGNGPHGEFSCHGAQDALDFYNEVEGDLVQLRQSYEWAWLASYALVKRNLEPGR